MYSNDYKYLWIILVSSFHYAVSPERIMSSRDRKLPFCTIRQVVQYALYHHGATYRLAGELIGGLDCATVRSNVSRIAKLIEPVKGKIPDKQIKKDVETIFKLITP